MIPERVLGLRNTGYVCSLAKRWQIQQSIAWRLVLLAERLEFPISVISGFRTCEQQDALRDAGRPAAPCDRSTHTTCPAQGVDVWPGVAVTDVVRARLGAEAVHVGFRWGGGSPVDPDTGIPSDWNHLDGGPAVHGLEVTGTFGSGVPQPTFG